MAGHTLEELVVRTGLISPTQLAVAQRDAAMRHRRLAPTLIDLGLISERRFADWMAQITRLPLADSIPEEAVHRLERRIPRAIAREYEVVPIAISDEEITVAMVNPLDEGGLEVLRTSTGLRIRPVIGVYSDIVNLVARFYPEDDSEPTVLPLPGFFPPSDGDESPGSTRIISPRRALDTKAVPAIAPAESQLDRVEKQLNSLTRHVEELSRKIDAIELLVNRVLPR